MVIAMVRMLATIGASVIIRRMRHWPPGRQGERPSGASYNVAPRSESGRAERSHQPRPLRHLSCAREPRLKPTTPDRIRNVALISHGGAGKTSLAEAMLFDAGAIQRLGSVDAGTATLDHDPDEQKRKQSINLAIGTLEARARGSPWSTRPATPTSSRDVIEALAAVDAAVVVVDASRRRGGRHRGGLAPGRRAQAAPLRVHQQDGPRERELRRGARPAQVTLRPEDRAGLPADRQRRGFKGYVDVIEQHANVYEGGTPKEVPDPGRDARRRGAAPRGPGGGRGRGVRRADDKYLEGEEISDAEIEAALHKGTREGSVVPVFVGSALKNIGVRELTAMIAKHVPSPAEVGRTGHDRRQADRARSIGPVRGAGVQDHRRPVRRPAHLLPGRLGHPQGAGPRLERDPARKRSASATCSACMGKDQSNMAQVGPGDIARGGQAGQHPDRRHAGRRPRPCARARHARPSRSRPCRSASSRSRRPTWTSWARRCSACWRRSRPCACTARTAPARRS